MSLEQRNSGWVFIQRTPESRGFVPGAVVDIYDAMHVPVGKVEVIDVADNFLLSVKPLATMIDSESGDMYVPGERFTAYLSGEKLHFIPMPDDEDEDW